MGKGRDWGEVGPVGVRVVGTRLYRGRRCKGRNKVWAVVRIGEGVI